MNYKETLDLLYNMLPDFQRVGAGAYKPGLDRIREFNRHLGFPDRSFYTIHIAGTNGKGSVSHILASVLQSAGYRVGLFTSPHLRDFRERIKVDGEMIPENAVVRFTESHLDKMRELDMSFFEATTAMAFDWFAASDVEVAVVETGLGGRLDSTNIIKPILSIITNIGFDHQSFLGDTIEQIAREKAGIIKHGVPVVVGEADARTRPLFEYKARKERTAIVFGQDLYECVGARRQQGGQTISFSDRNSGSVFEFDIDLMGSYQCQNLLTVITAINLLNKDSQLSISRRAIRTGIAAAAVSTGLRGRWEVIGRNPLVVCDTAHNEHGLRVVMEQIRGEQFEKLFMVLGFVNDKDISAIMPLLPLDAYYIFTQPAIDRAMMAAQLKTLSAAYGLDGRVVEDVNQALGMAREMASQADMIFVGGSNFVVAEVEELFK